MPFPDLGVGHEATRVHHPSRRHGGSVAACGPGPAADNPGDWIPQWFNASWLRAYGGCVPSEIKETGYVEGQNVAIEYRWAEGHLDRLPALAADLVRRQVSVIAATSTPANLVAKKATSTMPIIFTTGSDPVRLGLVASLARPGGNAAGVTQLSVEILPKRIELAHELVPTATTIALLVNPGDLTSDFEVRSAQAATHTLRVTASSPASKHRSGN